MKDTRPTPESILAKLKEEESSQGKLKIFFGAAAGVGKTYSMLTSAHKLRNDGIDVVAGHVITHGRAETESLLSGLESLLSRTIEYRGAKLEEFDLDTALVRKPEVILVDELAHTNAPDSRHERRWQDVEELLAAGIDVYTTLNVQHLESANDIVAQVTGVRIRETVPDSVFENAYEVELIDLPPDDLIQRLREGKVYMPEQSKTALEHFFRKGNLIALRELALRATAQRVEGQMDQYRSEESITQVWPAAEKILVCIGPGPISQRLVRSAKRMSSALHAEWYAATVETPQNANMPEQNRNHALKTLTLAKQLGAETLTLSGAKVSEELISFAHEKNVSKIVIGKPMKPRWKELLFGSIVDEVIRLSGDIDVYVITGDSDSPEPAHVSTKNPMTDIESYFKALFVLGGTTGIAAFLARYLALVNLVMLYQLAVVVIALKYGRGVSIFSSVLAVMLFDFFFVPPQFSFAVSDTQYILTLFVMLVVALTLSTLTFQVKHQAELARQREKHTSALYRMTREQALALTRQAILATSVRHLAEVFNSRIAVFLLNEAGQLAPVQDLQQSFETGSHEIGVAHWVFTNKQMAGIGTTTLPGAKALYLPLIGPKGPIGVIGILPSDSKILQNPTERYLLETFVNQTVLAIERANLAEELSRTGSSGFDFDSTMPSI